MDADRELTGLLGGEDLFDIDMLAQLAEALSGRAPTPEELREAQAMLEELRAQQAPQ